MKRVDDEDAVASHLVCQPLCPPPRPPVGQQHVPLSCQHPLLLERAGDGRQPHHRHSLGLQQVSDADQRVDVEQELRERGEVNDHVPDGEAQHNQVPLRPFSLAPSSCPRGLHLLQHREHGKVDLVYLRAPHKVQRSSSFKPHRRVGMLRLLPRHRQLRVPVIQDAACSLHEDVTAVGVSSEEHGAAASSSQQTSRALSLAEQPPAAGIFLPHPSSLHQRTLIDYPLFSLLPCPILHSSPHPGSLQQRVLHLVTLP
mmetsp:Transcript_11898/g.27493  ORF Transcript_11898/g.27493 Transcript_11898/m.27493 type:complete len:256 (+) Transcript_11898:1154-1921(+)